MNGDLDPTSIDWNSPDLKPLIEHFKAKFERQDEIIQQQDERNRQLEADLKRRDEEIAQLKAVIKKMGGKTSTV